MRANIGSTAPRRNLLQTLNALLDKILSTPSLYAVLCVIFLQPRIFLHRDEELAAALNLPSFPFFRILLYGLLTLVFLCYALRKTTGKTLKSNPALLCITGMFLYLAVITFVFDGASGYHIDWHCGFALMMLIDMGLQRERNSLVRGFTAALEIWVYLNVLMILLFPESFAASPTRKEWLIGNRVVYYRIVFPALAMALVRYHVLGKKMKWRTFLLIGACAFTVIIQRGGTAMISAALFVGLLIWCSRRALPRYITPVTFILVALLVFVGIHFFDVHKLFAEFITKGLGKTITLSSRTLIWKKAMQIVFKNPITGIGYLPVAYKWEILGRKAASHTHNQLLELMLHGGIIAVFLYLGAVFFSAKAALQHRRSPAVKTVAILVCTFAFMGVVEIFHNDPIYYALFVLLARADCLAKDVKQLPRISIFTRIKRDIKKTKNRQK
ncbi:MAG: O-antigen ligase family protein [Clostridia bacterium]|nr:O-antigen ligase family protein [Clostridia bacterium]